jgi:hypothetical protein
MGSDNAQPMSRCVSSSTLPKGKTNPQTENHIMELTHSEKKLLAMLEKHGKIVGGPIVQIDRNSIRRGKNVCDESTNYNPKFQPNNKEFDLSFQGVEIFNDGTELNFSACLKLACISKFTKWWEPKIANMSDYHNMAGDWSAIRDSSDETIDRIFEEFVLSIT